MLVHKIVLHFIIFKFHLGIAWTRLDTIVVKYGHSKHCTDSSVTQLNPDVVSQTRRGLQLLYLDKWSFSGCCRKRFTLNSASEDKVARELGKYVNECEFNSMQLLQCTVIAIAMPVICEIYYYHQMTQIETCQYVGP